jgi:hypothetical protein
MKSHVLQSTPAPHEWHAYSKQPSDLYAMWGVVQCPHQAVCTPTQLGVRR